MIFHHENGACYIVDCGSAHGTFLNGVRIPAPSGNGQVIPFKVRRGALIRFGGPGAPQFLLKSFSFDLKDVTDLTTTSDMGELVRRNTRINALGQNTKASLLRSNVAATIEAALLVSRKRSFDSIDSESTLDCDDCVKRARCTSPPLTCPSPLRLVSPDLPGLDSRRRVSFSQEPQLFYPALVTPLTSDSE
jgi:hypothetical protein